MKNKIITMFAPSGARIVLEKDENASYVAFAFTVFKGSAVETPENFGVAHFLEHMMFKSSKNHKTLEISEKMESLGGDMNAYTSNDVTCYTFRCLPEKFAECAEVFGDMLSNPLFLEDEFEQERKVIFEEIDMNEDNPNRTAFLQMHIAMISNFIPYAHSVAGTKGAVNKLTPKHLREFMDKHYLGDNITFSVVGNLDLLDVTRVLRKDFAKYFGGKGLAPSKPSYVRPISKKQIIAIPRDVNQVKLHIGFSAPSIKDEEAYLASIFNRVFGRGCSSRLYAEIREIRGLAYSISSGYSHGHQFGYIAVSAGVNPQNLETTKDAIFGILNDIAEDGISDKELERAKVKYKSARAFYKDNKEYICEDNAEDVYLYDRVIPEEEIIAKVDAITKQDIKQFAKKLLRSRIVISACGPDVKEEQLKIPYFERENEK